MKKRQAKQMIGFRVQHETIKQLDFMVNRYGGTRTEHIIACIDSIYKSMQEPGTQDIKKFHTEIMEHIKELEKASNKLAERLLTNMIGEK